MIKIILKTYNKMMHEKFYKAPDGFEYSIFELVQTYKGARERIRQYENYSGIIKKEKSELEET